MIRTALLATVGCCAALATTQDRLASWPVAKKQQQDSREQNGLIKLGLCESKWVDPTHFAYKKGNEWYLITLPAGKETKLDKEPESTAGTAGSNPNARRRRPGRGGQFGESLSADGKVKATYRDGNVWIQTEGQEPQAVTTDGDLSKRIKYGTASWVYGEELEQSEALGVRPDGKKVWYYRFDETKVIDNRVVFGQNTPQPVFEPQAYPKPGHDNPQVDLFVYDVAAKRSVPVQVRAGVFDLGVGHYIYDIQWSPDRSELFYRRTDRRQKVMEFCAANPDTGVSRVIVREEWPQSFVENKLRVWFCDEFETAGAYGGKMVWESSRTGFINLYMVDMRTGATSVVTKNPFDVRRVVKLDLPAGKVYYMGRGGTNPYNDQLFVATLDGKSNRMVTDPKFNHSVTVSSDGKYAVDIAQTCQDPPSTRLIEMSGKVVKTLAESDVSAFLAAGYSLPERVVFTSRDGKTTIHGALRKPRHFDASLKYPLLVGVYGGPLDPHESGFNETFRAYDADCGYGVVTASFDNRGTGGRGKAFSDPMYGHMGVVEMDDQAAGTKAVVDKGFIDPQKVGISGTSYGGYSSIMCLLRHPEVFKAAVACSAVTDWHNYDTIYTERYMGLADENKAGYDAGSAMTYANKLQGALMVYYGTADENVHPCNTLQLLQRFQRLGKWVEVQVGTDAGHSAVDPRREMEFFFERLNIPRG